MRKVKCTKCKVEMEQGMLIANGTTWRKGKLPIIFPLRGNSLAKIFPFFTPIEYVKAYKCPKCRRLRLYTTEGK